VVTLRGDFFAQALEHRSLADRMQDALVTLGPMTPEELREVIERPAQKVGLELQDGLAGRIVDDVQGEPGNLPLLEFVLTELWQLRDHGRLLHDAYEELGKAEGAIAKRAEDAFKRLRPEEREVARRTLLRLVSVGVGMAAT